MGRKRLRSWLNWYLSQRELTLQRLKLFCFAVVVVLLKLFCFLFGFPVLLFSVFVSSY